MADRNGGGKDTERERETDGEVPSQEGRPGLLLVRGLHFTFVKRGSLI